MDYSRIKELGPDQAAAEWLVRCGAVVKFKNMDKWSTDYNCLPRGTSGQFFIEEVDATDSSIMHVGFDYFSEYFATRDWTHLVTTQNILA